MNDDLHLSEDDRDAALARRIGAALEMGSIPKSDEEGEFYSALLTLRRQVQENEEHPPSDSSRRLWDRIDTITQEDSRKRDRPPIRVFRRRLAWAGATVGLVLAAVAILFLSREPAPKLVASAASDIVMHTFSDGSVVTLRPHSKLYSLNEAEQITRYRLEGEALFSVTYRPERTFEVEAGEAAIRVLGTRFNASTWGDRPSVYLNEGSIRFEHKTTGTSVVLSPGEWSSLNEEGEPLEPVRDEPDEHLDWLLGEMNFERRSAKLLVAELQQHFDIAVKIPAEIQEETLSGRILLRSESQSLEDLGTAMGGRFVMLEPGSYRFQSE